MGWTFWEHETSPLYSWLRDEIEGPRTRMVILTVPDPLPLSLLETPVFVALAEEISDAQRLTTLGQVLRLPEDGRAVIGCTLLVTDTAPRASRPRTVGYKLMDEFTGPYQSGGSRDLIAALTPLASDEPRDERAAWLWENAKRWRRKALTKQGIGEAQADRIIHGLETAE